MGVVGSHNAIQCVMKGRGLGGGGVIKDEKLYYLILMYDPE